jgi:hypothetical protein
VQHLTQIVNASTSAALAGGKTADLANAMGGAAKQSSNMDKALEKSRKSARDAAQGFVGLGDNVDNTKVSLSQWIHQMQASADALRNFRHNAETAAKKGLDQGLIASLEKAGPAGALRMRQLANATQTEIGKANNAWQAGRREVNRFTDAIGGVPNSHTVNLILAGGDVALAKAREVAAELRNLRDKTVHLTVIRSTGGHSVGGNADGGWTIAGQRHPYGDKVLAYLAPGEEVITNRHGEADRFRADRASGRIPRYADGGTAGATSTSASDRGDSKLSGHIKSLERALSKLQNSVDADKQSRDKIRSAEQSLASSVSGGFRSDLFGTSSPWAAGGSPVATLRADIANARQFNRALHRAARKGLSGGAFQALAESGNLQAALFEAGQSGSDLHRTDRLFRARQRITNRNGQFAGDVVVGERLAQSNAELRKANSHLQRLEQEMRHLRAEAKKHPKATGDAVAAGVNNGVRNGVRRVRHK